MDAAISVPTARGPTWTRSRVGAIGLSVGGEMLLESAADSDALKAVGWLRGGGHPLPSQKRWS